MKRYRAIIPAAIILAGAILRVWDITKTQLWYDESFTLLISQLSITDLIRATAGDVHPPLYYLITSVLLSLLPGLAPALVLRGFSVVCSVLGLAALWKLSEVLNLPLPGRWAALAFLAAWPVELYYAQEARMYSLFQLLVIVQAIAIYREKYWLLSISTLLVLYTHNYGLIFWAVLLAGGLFLELPKPRRVYRPGIDSDITPGMKNLFLAMGIPLLLWLPWTLVLAGQMKDVAQGYWIQPVSIGGVLLQFFNIMFGFYIPSWNLVPAVLTFGAVLFLLALNGLRVNRLFLLIWLVGPLAGAAIGSVIWKPMLLARGLFPSLPAMALLAGEVFASATGAGKVGRWALLVPFIACLGWQIGANHIGYGRSSTIWLIEPENKAIVHLEGMSYLTGRANWPKEKHYLLDVCSAQVGALTGSTRERLKYQYISLDDLAKLQDYVLVAYIGPLTKKCHEELLQQLTSQRVAVQYRKTKFEEYGIWK